VIQDQLVQVRDYWDAVSCGEALYLSEPDRASYEHQARERYRLEPEILDFAQFDTVRGRDVLEIGLGLGADHQRFAEADANLWGVDLTPRSVEHVRHRLELFGLSSRLQTGNAEHLDFPDDSFDLVYSWGVLHHTPDTTRAIQEVYRVLRPGGEAKIMIYHKHSFVGYMLWVRYGLGRGRPWMPLAEVFSRYLESPGTKAYTTDEARALFDAFELIELRTHLTHADLLTSEVGQRHRGLILSTARRLWPRELIRRFPNHGLFLTVRARKPTLAAAAREYRDAATASAGETPAPRKASYLATREILS
jgi:ubiquinone/menaquinone biosynthesis C-methylase UbiE